jgi:hypothetical protein
MLHSSPPPPTCTRSSVPRSEIDTRAERNRKQAAHTLAGTRLPPFLSLLSATRRRPRTSVFVSNWRAAANGFASRSKLNASFLVEQPREFIASSRESRKEATLLGCCALHVRHWPCPLRRQDPLAMELFRGARVAKLSDRVWPTATR